MTDQDQLAYERHIAEVLKLRAPRKEKPSLLETWLNSSGVAALIGVVGTGLLGAWVSGLIQDRSRNNELQRTSQQQKLTEQNAAVARILTMTASYSSAIDDLFTIVNNNYAENRFKGQELKDLVAWKKKIRNAHDDADSTWRRDKITAGYTLLYFFDNDPVVERAWASLSKAGDTFEACANNWYIDYASSGTEDRPDQICTDERQRLGTALIGFTAAAASKRVTAPQAFQP